MQLSRDFKRADNQGKNKEIIDAQAQLGEVTREKLKPVLMWIPRGRPGHPQENPKYRGQTNVHAQPQASFFHAGCVVPPDVPDEIDQQNPNEDDDGDRPR